MALTGVSWLADKAIPVGRDELLSGLIGSIPIVGGFLTNFEIVNHFAAQYPNITITLSFMIILAGWLLTPHGKRYVVSRLFAPDFLRWRHRAYPKFWQRPDTPVLAVSCQMAFAGRAEELAALLTLTEQDQQFCWRTLYGPAEVGKCRLALEWLRALTQKEDQRWDVGFLKSSLDNNNALGELATWAPRRATAIVIDEAGLREDTEKVMAQLASRKDKFRHPVRVLLLDQQEKWLDDTGAEEAQTQQSTQINDCQAEAPLFLPPFSTIIPLYRMIRSLTGYDVRENELQNLLAEGGGPARPD